VPYTVLFIRCRDEPGYVVRVPALRGCVTQGEDLADAIDMGREAIQAYTESLRMDDEPIPEDVRTIELYEEEEDEVLILRLSIPERTR
jgi:predicted RNase H-like HicB family nuclease